MGCIPAKGKCHKNTTRELPNAQTALQELHSLRVLAKLVGDLGEVRERLSVVRVQHTAGLHSALLCLTKVFEGMRQGIGAEEHFAVIEQHAHVVGMQRRWLANRRAVRDVRGSERGKAAAAEVEISGEKLQANLETQMSAKRSVVERGFAIVNYLERN
jgi:hypothetical protein